MQLFAARLDVYPQRWENKAGKSGYSPVCANEWVDPICKKPKIKCTDCSHQIFLSLDELAVESHLKPPVSYEYGQLTDASKVEKVKECLSPIKSSILSSIN